MTPNHKLAGIFEEELAPLIEQVMDGYGLAGLGVGVVKDGTVLFAGGFGKRNLATGEPVTVDSLFHMASVSKPFVATAILQLWEAGRLDLDAPVRAYLPYFALQGGDSGRITIRHLLSHTGGVPDTDNYAWRQPEYDDGALERYVRSLAGEEMIAAPGERFSYSNPAFEALGAVIATVSGQSFEFYVKRHVLDPLGMRGSTFLRQEVPPISPPPRTLAHRWSFCPAPIPTIAPTRPVPPSTPAWPACAAGCWPTWRTARSAATGSCVRAPMPRSGSRWQ